MKTIWKAVLRVTDAQDIEIPQYAEFLTAREQHDQITVWFRCDPTQPKVKRRIMIVGTGYTVEESAMYIGTAILRSGHLVLHVFDQTQVT